MSGSAPDVKDPDFNLCRPHFVPWTSYPKPVLPRSSPAYFLPSAPEETGSNEDGPDPLTRKPWPLVLLCGHSWPGPSPRCLGSRLSPAITTNSAYCTYLQPGLQDLHRLSHRPRLRHIPFHHGWRWVSTFSSTKSHPEHPAQNRAARHRHG